MSAADSLVRSPADGSETAALRERVRMLEGYERLFIEARAARLFAFGAAETDASAALLTISEQLARALDANEFERLRHDQRGVLRLLCMRIDRAVARMNAELSEAREGRRDGATEIVARRPSVECRGVIGGAFDRVLRMLTRRPR